MKLASPPSSTSFGSPAYPSSASFGSPAYPSPGASTVSRESTESRLLELRLLHNFTARTAKTFSTNNVPGAEEAWQISVPQMALESPCLMDTMLAVSALHLRSEYPNDSNLIQAFHGYMASALSKYSTCLANGVDESNAEPLFVTSALIAFQATASRRFPDEEKDQKGYNLPLQWFHSFQGVKHVVISSWVWLRESERVRPIVQTQPAVELDLNPNPSAIFGPLLEGLEQQLENMDESLRSDTRQAYAHAVAYLNWAHQNPIRTRILGFPAAVSRRFVELIDQRDPRALVLISCFCAMTTVADVWWWHGVGKREVNGIMSLLPEDWLHKMEWPKRIVDHEGPMKDEVWGGIFNPQSLATDDTKSTADVRLHIDILAHTVPGNS